VIISIGLFVSLIFFRNLINLMLACSMCGACVCRWSVLKVTQVSTRSAVCVLR